MDRLRALAFALFVGAGICVSPGTARADDPYGYTPYDPVALSPAYDFYVWSGFYIGGHLGAAYTQVDATSTVIIDGGFAGFEGFDQSATSFAGGVQAGWQKQWGSTVAGIEITYTGMDFSETSPTPFDPIFTQSSDVSNVFTVVGRLGYAFERWLAYIKGGYANADIDITFTNTDTGASTSADGREGGWTAGAGIEYALTPTLILGLEYNYLHFGVDAVEPGLSAGGQSGDIDVDIQTFLVRLSYKFGPRNEAAPPPPGPIK